METKTKPQTTYLKDYQKPDYLITKTHLDIAIHDGYTIVTGTLDIQKNHETSPQNPLILHGENLELISVKVDGTLIDSPDKEGEDLRLDLNTHTATVETQVRIYPEKNFALEGLYKSDDIYCTQNEPEGFRKITYYLDRPDVMSRFTTRVSAAKEGYPVLLSNGNPIKREDLGDRHAVTWEDPFPKPSYLFAVVAGDLGKVSDTFITQSGRTIQLEIYVDKGNESRCSHAMESLKKSMKWDEEVFGLEYDLDIFMIVAVDAFNMGAMENKGLNIFNSHYILADTKSATDNDFLGIEAVVAHEYFHNWTGNRVTCRDWFQLTLKEGLTVFRDEEFSSDMNDRAVKRIQDVRGLREGQFVEDSGPLAHPIRPASYMQINNFYTNTVYRKGAEVIRMIHTYIGKASFRKGIDLYFKNFDGQAVTTEDFLWAMETASGKDLTQFKRWYHQAGTPHCEITTDYQDGTLSVTVKQSCRPTPETPEKKPFQFPLALGFVSPDGKALSVDNAGREQETVILSITKEQETFQWSLSEEPILSVLRDFSAPVTVTYNCSDTDLMTLAQSDPDRFNAYESVQTLAKRHLKRLMRDIQNKTELTVPTDILETILSFLDRSDPAFIGMAIVLPSLTQIMSEDLTHDHQSAFEAREYLANTLAAHGKDQFLQVYQSLNKELSHPKKENAVDANTIGKRQLKNICLSYLVRLGEIALAKTQYDRASNMTDQISALNSLCQTKTPSPERDKALSHFYETWKDDPLVMNKWFTIQAAAPYGDSLALIHQLEKDPVFDPKNPNKMRALYGSFCRNAIHFHTKAGYEWLIQKIINIDQFNPQMASGLAQAFRNRAKTKPELKVLLDQGLDRILNQDKISSHVYEIVSKIRQG